jgi:hypothetical protein
MKSTKHAEVRAQQRAIPPFVDWLLDEFGEEEYDGRGCVRVYFTRRSVRKMEQSLGHQPVGLFKRYLRAFKVECCSDGTTVTKGWQTRHIWRR